MLTRREFSKAGVGFAAFAVGAQVITSAGNNKNDDSSIVPLEVAGKNKMSDNQIILDDKTLFIKIQEQFEKANSERLVENLEAANKLLKQALDELGNRYAREADESGDSIIKANSLEREGKLNEAVYLRRFVLEYRLEQFRIKMIDDQPAMDNKTLFVKLQEQFGKIDTEIVSKNWKVANELLKQALAELGSQYNNDVRIQDESNRRLVLARVHEEEGKLDEAVSVRFQIFTERLEMLKNKK